MLPLNGSIAMVHAGFGVAQTQLEHLLGKSKGPTSRSHELLGSSGHDKQPSNEL